MNNPRLSLALTMESNPGVFALLLGSGVSREAEVPTGWEVTLDLIEKLAALEEEDTGGEPAAWYREKYDSPAEYSDILEKVAHTPAERRELLRSYFEPTEEEREQEVKTPSAAHEAVAELVSQGFIRVILTTNFDRLVEQALEARGITPNVISTADQAVGAPPLIHSKCSVVKVNGDYRDERIRNTPEELQEYPEEIDELLDRVLDEFGLVACGWSAEWDGALRSAIERCPTRRYSTYWTKYAELTDAAERLVGHRDGSVIEIEGADEFLSDLAGKVFGLQERAKAHPASVEAAVGTTKRYLTNGYLIRLHDLVMEEANTIHGRLSSDAESSMAGFDEEALLQTVRRHEDYAEVLQHVFSVGCYWGSEEHHDIWIKGLERVANPAGQRGPKTRDLLRYPALLLTYAGGIAALAGEKYETLNALLTDAHVWDVGGPREEEPLILEVYAFGGPLTVDAARRLPGVHDRAHVPLSEWLSQVLRDPLRRVVPDDERYERLFDLYEYLAALVHVHVRNRNWGPPGRFAYKWRHTDRMGQIRREAEAEGADWPPLAAGLFGGSLERFLEVKEAFDDWCWSGGKWM